MMSAPLRLGSVQAPRRDERRVCFKENLSRVYGHINKKRTDPFSADGPARRAGPTRRTDAPHRGAATPARRASQRRGYTGSKRVSQRRSYNGTFGETQRGCAAWGHAAYNDAREDYGKAATSRSTPKEAAGWASPPYQRRGDFISSSNCNATAGPTRRTDAPHRGAATSGAATLARLHWPVGEGLELSGFAGRFLLITLVDQAKG
jgi:hypothetical protein